MTEAEAREIVVTDNMIKAGALSYMQAAENNGCRHGDDSWEYGIKAAFPTMLRVWLEQGAPGWSVSRGNSAVAR